MFFPHSFRISNRFLFPCPFLRSSAGSSYTGRCYSSRRFYRRACGRVWGFETPCCSSSCLAVRKSNACTSTHCSNTFRTTQSVRIENLKASFSTIVHMNRTKATKGERKKVGRESIIHGFVSFPLQQKWDPWIPIFYFCCRVSRSDFEQHCKRRWVEQFAEIQVALHADDVARPPRYV